MKPISLNRRGVSVIYLAFIMVPLVAFLAVAWDFGRVRFGRAQLQNATDGAARAGAYGVPFDIAVNNATTIAADNRCLLQSVQLAGGDVKLGWWDVNKLTFTEIKATGGTNDPALTANAVAVRAYRTKARSNPVNYTIMPVVGVNSGDITTLAVAMVTGLKGTGLGFVGLTSISMNGNDSTDSYDPTVGYQKNSPGSNGAIASNGTISLTGSIDINGDARPGIGQTVKITGSSDVTGWRAPLDYTLSYPMDSAPANISATNNDNSRLPAGAVDANGNLTKAITIPGGTTNSPARYYFNSINISGGPANLIIGGNTTILVGTGGISLGNKQSLIVNDGGSINNPQPVKIYSQGNVSLSGGASTQSTLASDLYVSVITAGKSISMGGNTAADGHFYDPAGDITFNGTPDMYGWAIGNTLTLKGDVGLHYDGTNTVDPAHVLTITLVE